VQTLPFIQPANLTPYGNTLYFTGSHPTAYYRHIWKLQAGSNDAQLVEYFSNQYTWPGVGPFFDMGSQGLLFHYKVATSGNPNITFAPGIWKKLDPTTGDIVDMCTDCFYDAEYGDEAYLWYGKLYFPARGTGPASGHGMELWVTDGTALGTHELFDLNPGAGSSYPYLIRPVDGTMFFSGNDGVVGRELWSFDISLSHVFLPMTTR
jgi:ELWxxDGT repeat protein